MTGRMHPLSPGRLPPPPDDLVDAEALATMVDVSESTIRSWAHRGLIRKFPQGHRKRTLYSVAEVLKAFTESGRNT